MNRSYNIIVIDKWELVAVEFLHATGFELPQCDLFVSDGPVELFIGQLQQFFELRQNRVFMLIMKDCFNYRLHPLIHERIVILKVPELPAIVFMHFAVYEFIDDLGLGDLLLRHLLLHFVHNAFIFLESFNTAVFETLFSFFPFLLDLGYEPLQDVRRFLFFLLHIPKVDVLNCTGISVGF